MDVDDDSESGGDNDDDNEMNVDIEEQRSSKKVKTNSGSVVVKRVPRTDRTLAGFRDIAVRPPSTICSLCLQHL